MNHASPFSKVLTFYRKEPFSLEAYYNSPNELPFKDPTIGKLTARVTFNHQEQKKAHINLSNVLANNLICWLCILSILTLVLP